MIALELVTSSILNELSYDPSTYLPSSVTYYSPQWFNPTFFTACLPLMLTTCHSFLFYSVLPFHVVYLTVHLILPPVRLFSFLFRLTFLSLASILVLRFLTTFPIPGCRVDHFLHANDNLKRYFRLIRER